jgi:hypothetical protein
MSRMIKAIDSQEIHKMYLLFSIDTSCVLNM